MTTATTPGPAAPSIAPPIPIIDPATRGIAPLTEAPRVMTIAGVEYRMRRLGLTDIFAACKLFREIFVKAGLQVAMQFVRIDTKDKEQMTTLLLLGFTHVENELFDFMAGLISVDPADMRDPDKFPLDSAIDLLDGLINHPDARLFFSRLTVVAKDAVRLTEEMAKAAGIAETTDPTSTTSDASSATSNTGTPDGLMI